MKHDHSAFGDDDGRSIGPTFDPRPFLPSDRLLDASLNAYPIVARRTVAKDRLGPAAGAVCALLLGGATFLTLAQHRSPLSFRHAIVRPPAIDDAPGDLPALPRPAIDQPRVRPSEPAANPTIATLPSMPPTVPEIAPMPSAVAAATNAAPEASTSAPADAGTLHRGWAPMLVVDGGNAVEDAPSAAAAKDAAASSDTPVATRMGDPARTIAQGSLIPAVLETAINSDLPGYARAVVTRDVRSFDGSQVLIPRSSRLIGEYKSGLADGQKRVYVTWIRLIRPDGVSIAIASPATAPSGGTGLAGQVNSHFVQRFGSAILLTVVGAASAVGSSGLVLAGSQSAASVAATHDAAIPPTIRIRPGQPVRVFTAHDLDFSTIATTSAQ